MTPGAEALRAQLEAHFFRSDWDDEQGLFDHIWPLILAHVEQLERERDALDRIQKENANAVGVWAGRALSAEDQFAASRAEVERVTARQQWQPMETSPKDGSWILAFVPKTGRAHAVQWDAKFEYQFDEETEKERYRGAWTDWAILSYNDQEVHEYQPTHWQPLPAAPDAGTPEPGGEGR